MKKGMFFAVAALAAGLAVAAQNDALITFSTPGPDKYADGDTVMDGECYALVFTPKGSSGAVFAADGTVEGGEIVLVAPVAKDGKCPKVLFQVDAEKIKTRYSKGTWGVYLLDTRKWGDDGKPYVSGVKNGKVTVVNASDRVATPKLSLATGTISSYSGVGEAMAATGSALPGEAEATRPVVTGIRIEGGNVFVSVKGTLPYLQYSLFAGDTPAGADVKEGALHSGADAVDDEIVLVTEAGKDGGFFRVGRTTVE